MHAIYLVRRGRKYHTDQSHVSYSVDSFTFFYLREGAASLTPSITMGYYAML